MARVLVQEHACFLIIVKDSNIAFQQTNRLLLILMTVCLILINKMKLIVSYFIANYQATPYKITGHYCRSKVRLISDEILWTTTNEHTSKNLHLSALYGHWVLFREFGAIDGWPEKSKRSVQSAHDDDDDDDDDTDLVSFTLSEIRSSYYYVMTLWDINDTRLKT